jgi:hypothetical protein
MLMQGKKLGLGLALPLYAQRSKKTVKEEMGSGLAI